MSKLGNLRQTWAWFAAFFLAGMIAPFHGNGAETPPPKPASPEISYADYAAVLKAYVNDRGMVNYRELKTNRGKLDAFVATLGDADPAPFEKWTDKQKVAFWINAYNACTLKAIIDNYPIKSSVGTSLFYPKNSIRQISGAWDKIEFNIMGKNITLNDMEHKQLRASLKESRVHMALVCAAMSCPPLRNEPYVAAKLDAQFVDQSERFLATATKFQIDRQKNVVHLSPIFKWFGGDFVKNYGTDQGFAGHDATERAVLNYISKNLGEQDAGYLRTSKYKISYLDYDWSLNEQ